MKDLQKNVQAIRMPEDMQQRLLSGFPPEKRRFSPALIAAVLALCLLLPSGAYAAGKAGFFKDVKRWDGAVVGTAYENATEEISVTADLQDSWILVTVTILNPDKAPYPYIETLSIGKYQLLNENGKIVSEGTTDAVALKDGQVIFSLNNEDAHALRISQFTANAKAEHPLPIYGNWELLFHQ